MKPCKTYRGVKIFRAREEIPGSSLKELKDGRFVPCEPKFYPPTFQFAGSYRYDSVQEAVEAIETVFVKCCAVGGETRAKEFAETMNTDWRAYNYPNFPELTNMLVKEN